MRRLLPILLLGIHGLLLADEIRVYELHYRSATEIIPLIEPHLDPQAGLSGMGYQLIIKGDARTHESVQSLLAKIDRKPRNLMISVRSTQVGERSRSGIHTEGVVKVPSNGNVGGGFVIGTENARHREDRASRQSLRVLEGQQAYIRVGEERPTRGTHITITPAHVFITRTTDYRSAGQGFFVQPRLSNGEVILDISTEDSRFVGRKNETVATAGVNTTVSGRLGEWIPLGGIDSQMVRDERGIVSTADQTQRLTGEIEVRVDVVD